MLQAMNTGHDGSLTRCTPIRRATRLAPGSHGDDGQRQHAPDRIRQQITSAVQILVQCSRMSDGTRRVTSITEITGMEGDIVTLQDIFVFEKRGLGPDGRVRGRFAATGFCPSFTRSCWPPAYTFPTTSSTRWWTWEAVMLTLFLLAAVTGVVTYRLLWQRLERRDTALAVRRLSAPAVEKGSARRGRPRLIEASGEVRSLFTDGCWTVCGCAKRPGVCSKRRPSSGGPRTAATLARPVFWRIRDGHGVYLQYETADSPGGGRGARDASLVVRAGQGAAQGQRLRGAVPGLPGIRLALHARRARLLGGH